MQSRLGLARAGDVVLLAFHRHKGDVAYGRQVDQLAAMKHLALGQLMLHENLVDCLQVILRRKIHDGEIFVVEIFVLLHGIPVAAHQVHEQLFVCVHVAVEVHGHEAGKLEEARIHEAAVALIWPRHRCDDRAPEPIGAFLLGKLIDGGWTDARIDRASLQDHAPRQEGMLGVSISAIADMTGTPG